MNLRSREASDLQSDAIDRSAISPLNKIWTLGESNPWPPACKAGALPTKLRAQKLSCNKSRANTTNRIWSLIHSEHHKHTKHYNKKPNQNNHNSGSPKISLCSCISTKNTHKLSSVVTKRKPHPTQQQSENNICKHLYFIM